jgi:hypothetical protein
MKLTCLVLIGLIVTTINSVKANDKAECPEIKDIGAFADALAEPYVKKIGDNMMSGYLMELKGNPNNRLSFQFEGYEWAIKPQMWENIYDYAPVMTKIEKIREEKELKKLRCYYKPSFSHNTIEPSLIHLYEFYITRSLSGRSLFGK